MWSILFRLLVMFQFFFLVLFQFIIITILSCRKYNNAEETDLWEALMEQIRETPGSFLPNNVSVTQVMDSWTLQDGYPVLTVTRNYNDGSATVSQVRKSNTGKKLWRWRELVAMPNVALRKCF